MRWATLGELSKANNHVPEQISFLRSLPLIASLSRLASAVTCGMLHVVYRYVIDNILKCRGILGVNGYTIDAQQSPPSEVHIPRTAKATEKRAETEGESLRMNQQIHELALAKQNGSERVYDSHDSKCMRMLINSCAVDADDQPIAALSDKPTPGSMVVIGTWIGTITKRTLEPVDRAEKYGLNFTPTTELTGFLME